MKIITFLSLLLLVSCQQKNNSTKVVPSTTKDVPEKIKDVPEKIISTPKSFNPIGKTIITRFSPPPKFERIEAKDNKSFAYYLQHLPLKPEGTEVLYYNGATKANNGVYAAVVDLPIGKKDLHQCADAIMRLRAEHLFEQQEYAQIHFNFTNGFTVPYSVWKQGKRVIVEGNKTYWKQTAAPASSYKDFWTYLETIFTYAGTYSLSKELKTVAIEKMEIGAIFIQGGFPGHAVIVVDMAINNVTGERLFMLAQSYMPAQELQILKNPSNLNLSPWYNTNFDVTLNTPEWSFSKNDLKRFP